MSDWVLFVDQCDDLLCSLDDLPERAEDFADGVRTTIEGMRNWAEDHEHVTEKMQTALENTTFAVEKWL